MGDYSIQLLRELTEAHSVPGYEDEVRTLFRTHLDGCGEFGSDRNGSVYCRGDVSETGPNVLVAGHMDEIGFRVQSINSQGFLTFVPVGGWWGHNLLAQRVVVKSSSGEKIPGVVASKPPHFLGKAERGKVQELDAMFIDVSASSAEEVASWGVRVGDPIAPDASFVPARKEGRFIAKSFDNRVGMGGAIEIGKKMLGKTQNTLTVAGTVQEEVGLRGSKTLAYVLRPDVAIVLEGPPADDTPGFDLSTSQGVLGKGVQIRLHDPSAIMNPRLAEMTIALAEAENIPHQVTVRRSGGTDAGGFHLSGPGVPSIVLGVPARYIHSHNGIIDIADYQAMVELGAKLVEHLTAERFSELIQYI
ncbi:MAG: M42 family metallopeptidase [Verrucomicrobiota bacterium JB023]|nr:M42 family metallopeptidase [Verrucomicrobiota bacterium JB023]